MFGVNPIAQQGIINVKPVVYQQPQQQPAIYNSYPSYNVYPQVKQYPTYVFNEYNQGGGGAAYPTIVQNQYNNGAPKQQNKPFIVQNQYTRAYSGFGQLNNIQRVAFGGYGGYGQAAMPYGQQGGFNQQFPPIFG